MTRYQLILTVSFMAFMAIGLADAHARNRSKTSDAPQAQLTDKGKELESRYAAELAALKAEITRSLPVMDEQKLSALVKARDAVKAAQKTFSTAGGAADRVKTLNTAMGFWKKFGVNQSIQKLEKANADLKAATTDAQREAIKKEIAKWQQTKEQNEKKISNAEAEIAQLTPQVAGATKLKDDAKAALADVIKNETAAAKAFVAGMEPFLAKSDLDAKLVKCALLTSATPNGLAAFAQQSAQKAALVDKLLADDKLMNEMLVAGGAEAGFFGQAMEIYAAIQSASPKAVDGVLQRLALATSLELAKPATETKAKSQPKKTDDPDVSDTSSVDPVKCYLAYEKAYLNGELDPAFKTFSVWELRMAVDGNTPDEVLQWGRDMIRNYRPDFVRSPNYGWRYSALVKSDVRYGSENCKFDRPELNQYQNILKDGGVCGRRAFFGRFILRANGIPVWGVTQHKHAALSHWTPKGWVVNLGAGFDYSWWDKGDVAMSGSDFLLETQARRHPDDFRKVLRAQWISRILGEPAYNGRKGVDGGPWSSLSHCEAKMIASQEVELGPLGQELAEANLPDGAEEIEKSSVSKQDQEIVVAPDGKITIPAVAHGKSSGSGTAMKSHGKGMQLLGSAGFKTQYEFEAPRDGEYALSARVVTVQENKKVSFAANGAKAVEVAALYTAGMWQQTPPVEVHLNKGHNVLQFEVLGGGTLAIKDFTLTPAK